MLFYFYFLAFDWAIFRHVLVSYIKTFGVYFFYNPDMFVNSFAAYVPYIKEFVTLFGGIFYDSERKLLYKSRLTCICQTYIHLRIVKRTYIPSNMFNSKSNTLTLQIYMFCWNIDQKLKIQLKTCLHQKKQFIIIEK